MVASNWPTQPVTESLRRRISTGVFKPKHWSHASRVIPGSVYITGFERRKPTVAFQKEFRNTNNAKPASKADHASVPQTKQSTAAPACNTPRRRDREWTAARAAGSLHHLLHPNTGNPAAQNSSKWTRNMNYPNQAEVVNRFIIFIYLIPRPKTIYHLGAQDTNTLTYPLYILQVSFCRREANSKHQINVN